MTIGSGDCVDGSRIIGDDIVGGDCVAGLCIPVGEEGIDIPAADLALDPCKAASDLFVVAGEEIAVLAIDA